MNGVNGALEWRRRAGKLLLWNLGGRVQLICERVSKCCESIPDTMDVFANVHSSGTEVGQHFFKRHHLLLGLVSTVID